MYEVRGTGPPRNKDTYSIEFHEGTEDNPWSLFARFCGDQDWRQPLWDMCLCEFGDRWLVYDIRVLLGDTDLV